MGDRPAVGDGLKPGKRANVRPGALVERCYGVRNFGVAARAIAPKTEVTPRPCRHSPLTPHIVPVLC